jgi:hypothetical protein
MMRVSLSFTPPSPSITVLPDPGKIVNFPAAVAEEAGSGAAVETGINLARVAPMVAAVAIVLTIPSAENQDRPDIDAYNKLSPEEKKKRKEECDELKKIVDKAKDEDLAALVKKYGRPGGKCEKWMCPAELAERAALWKRIAEARWNQNKKCSYRLGKKEKETHEDEQRKAYDIWKQCQYFIDHPDL